MRKLVIPQEAIENHEATLGEKIRECLKHLKDGESVQLGFCEKKDKKGNICNVKQAVDEQVKGYWEWLYGQFERYKILTASPAVLILFAQNNIVKLAKVKSSCALNDITNVIQCLFDYKSFQGGKMLCCKEIKKNEKEGTGNKAKVKIWWSDNVSKVNDDSSYGKWSLAEFVRLIDVRYCPYCNAETVGVVYPDSIKGKKSFSAIDHILSKGDYPLLALSLYNLVPACFRCNSQFKGEKDLFDVKNWDSSAPLNALHPYAHDIHQWFRFSYKPSDVAHLFLKPQELISPLSAMLKTPLGKNCPDNRKKDREFYLKRVKKHLAQYRLLHSYRDLYATEINEILKMEMICTPTFIETMRDVYPGMSDEDFNLVFRRTSLDPREINKHRFAKLIIDLHKQIGDEVSPEKWRPKSDEKKSLMEIREEHHKAWEERKCEIDKLVRKWASNPIKTK